MFQGLGSGVKRKVVPAPVVSKEPDFLAVETKIVETECELSRETIQSTKDAVCSFLKSKSELMVKYIDQSQELNFQKIESISKFLGETNEEIVTHIIGLFDDKLSSDRASLIAYKKKILESLDMARLSVAQFRATYDAAARHRESEVVRIVVEEHDEKFRTETNALQEIIRQQEYSSAILTRKIEYLETEKKTISETVYKLTEELREAHMSLDEVKHLRKKVPRRHTEHPSHAHTVHPIHHSVIEHHHRVSSHHGHPPHHVEEATLPATQEHPIVPIPHEVHRNTAFGHHLDVPVVVEHHLKLTIPMSIIEDQDSEHHHHHHRSHSGEHDTHRRSHGHSDRREHSGRSEHESTHSNHTCENCAVLTAKVEEMVSALADCKARIVIFESKEAVWGRKEKNITNGVTGVAPNCPTPKGQYSRQNVRDAFPNTDGSAVRESNEATPPPSDDRDLESLGDVAVAVDVGQGHESSLRNDSISVSSAPSVQSFVKPGVLDTTHGELVEEGAVSVVRSPTPTQDSTVTPMASSSIPNPSGEQQPAIQSKVFDFVPVSVPLKAAQSAAKVDDLIKKNGPEAVPATASRIEMRQESDPSSGESRSRKSQKKKSKSLTKDAKDNNNNNKGSDTETDGVVTTTTLDSVSRKSKFEPNLSEMQKKVAPPPPSPSASCAGRTKERQSTPSTKSPPQPKPLRGSESRCGSVRGRDKSAPSGENSPPRASARSNVTLASDIELQSLAGSIMSDFGGESTGDNNFSEQEEEVADGRRRGSMNMSTSLDLEASEGEDVKLRMAEMAEELLQRANAIQLQEELQTRLLSLEFQNAKLSKRLRSEEVAAERQEALHQLRMQERGLLLRVLSEQVLELRTKVARYDAIQQYNAKMEVTSPVRQSLKSQGAARRKDNLPLPFIKFDESAPFGRDKYVRPPQGGALSADMAASAPALSALAANLSSNLRHSHSDFQALAEAPQSRSKSLANDIIGCAPTHSNQNDLSFVAENGSLDDHFPPESASELKAIRMQIAAIIVAQNQTKKVPTPRPLATRKAADAKRVGRELRLKPLEKDTAPKDA